MTREQPPWLLVEPGALALGTTVRLDPEESGHLVRALRRRVGDRVTLADGAGVVGEGVVRTARTAGAEIALETTLDLSPPPLPALALALAVLHGPAMDWAIQKAVEVGVERLTPLLTARTQVAAAVAGGRIPHWRRVARAALKQSRRAWALEIDEPCGLAELAAIAGGVVAHPSGGRLADLPAGWGGCLLVGPEGGLSAVEEELLEACGWWRLRLGPYTLRAETAAVTGAALLINR